MSMWLRPTWQWGPLETFVGCMDLKTGVTIVLMFSLLNKVAGVYGLITIFTNGSVAQLSMYFYSICGLVAIWWWGLKVVLAEHQKYTLYVAYAFLLDHVLSTIWLLYFGVEWWYYTPHDGQRIAHSAAQEQLMQSVGGHNMTQAETAIAAQAIWDQEKGTASAMLVMGWLARWYFAAVIFSYAFRLRTGRYHSLPQTNVPLSSLPHPEPLVEDDDDGASGAHDDYYRMQPRSPQTGTSIGSFRSAPRVNGGQYGGRYPNGFSQEPRDVLWDVEEDE